MAVVTLAYDDACCDQAAAKAMQTSRASVSQRCYSDFCAQNVRRGANIACTPQKAIVAKKAISAR